MKISRIMKSPLNDVIALVEPPDRGSVLVAISALGDDENNISADAVMPRLNDLGAHLDAFDKSSDKAIVVDIKSPKSAKERTLFAVNQGADAILFACRTRDAFFTVLAELGMGKDDLLALAQAYPLLSSVKESETRQSVTGNASRLLEAISDSGIYRWAGYSPEDKQMAREAYLSMADDIARSMKIYLGNVQADEDIADEEAACRLPYPVCLFEFSLNGRIESGKSTEIKAVALVQQEGDWLHTAFFRTHPPGQRFFFLGFGASWTMQDGRLAFVPELFTENPPSELGDDWFGEIGAYLKPLLWGLADINRPGVRLARISPPAKLQKARTAKRKPPLFDYHVVAERPSSRSESSEGSDRSGPRLHERRGHYRQLASGLRVWVRSAIVGAARDGVIGKEL